MKSNLFRVKVDFEGIPLTDIEVRGLKNAKKVFRDIEHKIGGKNG